MRVRNRDGAPVDPVPFLVSAGMAVMLLFSTGPLYGLAYGLSVRTSLVLSTAFAATVVWGLSLLGAAEFTLINVATGAVLLIALSYVVTLQ